jgi:hypothetical protein
METFSSGLHYKKVARRQANRKPETNAICKSLQLNNVTCYQKQKFYIHMHLRDLHSFKLTEVNEGNEVRATGLKTQFFTANPRQLREPEEVQSWEFKVHNSEHEGGTRYWEVWGA